MINTERYNTKNITPDIVERFHKGYLPEPNSGCWLWTGAWASSGYGQMQFRYRHNVGRAHIISYLIHKGDIPVGMVVCHSCDTPCCVNPDHLWVGTQAENMKDMWAKGRDSKNIPRKKGPDNWNTKLTDEQVIAIIQDPRSSEKVCKEFGVSISAVKKIRSGHLRKDFAHIPRPHARRIRSPEWKAAHSQKMKDWQKRLKETA